MRWPEYEGAGLRSALDASARGLALYRRRTSPDGASAFERGYANPAALRLGGFERREGVSASDAEIFAEVMMSGRTHQLEVEREDGDLGSRWVLETVRPNTDGVVVEFEDVTAARRRAEASDLLTRELSHRIKNVLAVVTSLVSLTSRGAEDKAAFVESLHGRLAALARAHDATSPLRSGGPCSIGDLLRAVLEPYREANGALCGDARIEIDACDQGLGPVAATGLALLIHELATNALKHGALSAAGGRVNLHCRQQGAHLTITWTEYGGPQIMGAPTSSGFGLQMSQRVLAGQLDGSMSYDWSRSGLTVRIEVPCARLAS